MSCTGQYLKEDIRRRLAHWALFLMGRADVIWIQILLARVGTELAKGLVTLQSNAA
jgi:hypothetical protein